MTSSNETVANYLKILSIICIKKGITLKDINEDIVATLGMTLEVYQQVKSGQLKLGVEENEF